MRDDDRRGATVANHIDVIPRLTVVGMTDSDLPPDGVGDPADLGFHVEHFSPEERTVLERHFTNLDSPVFAIVNLPEVVKGALFARYSRSPKSVRRLFIDEFHGAPETGVDAISTHLVDTGAAAPDAATDRAEQLYQRVFSEYGDDSVAQLGGAHLACEQASNVLTKVLERGRLASYLEQSTRYIAYDQRLGERYRYMTPPEISTSRHAGTYRSTMEWLFSTYSELLRRIIPYYEAMYPRQDGDSNFIWRSTIRAKACDDLRGLLPASTLSNVGIFASGQAYESMLLRMRSHPSAEVRIYGDLMLSELRKVIPSFLRRIDIPERGGRWSSYLADIRARLDTEAERLIGAASATPQLRNEVTLVDWNPDAEADLAAAVLYPHTDLPDDQLRSLVAGLDADTRREIILASVGDRSNRRHKPGRGWERVDYRFDILCDYGIFRDLQRHRLLTIDWQRLSPLHGYVTPDSIDDIGGSEVWREAMERTAGLHHDLAADLGAEIAQYVVPFAYRIRFFFQLNAREAMHLLELRSAAGGHPDYRRVAQEMHRLIADQAGHHTIAEAMSYVDHTDHDLARLEGERRAAAKRAALGITDPG